MNEESRLKLFIIQQKTLYTFDLLLLRRFHLQIQLSHVVLALSKYCDSTVISLKVRRQVVSNSTYHKINKIVLSVAALQSVGSGSLARGETKRQLINARRAAVVVWCFVSIYNLFIFLFCYGIRFLFFRRLVCVFNFYFYYFVIKLRTCSCFIAQCDFQI